MERIKEAIEKASAARQSVKHGTQPNRQTAPGALVPREWTQPPSIKVVEPDAKALQANRMLAFGNNESGFAGLDVLRTRVLQTIHEQGWKTIAITSPGPGAGKTFVALNLAASIARLSEERPLLVDFDFRKPSIASTLGLLPKPSLVDCLTRDTAPTDVFIRTRKPPLAILPNTRPIPNPSETIVSPRVKAMVEELKTDQSWSVVIFDLPPLLAFDDVLAFLPNIDCTLLVVALGLSTSKEIESCNELLMPHNLLGYVANKSDDRTNDYSQDYGIQLKADI